MVFIRTSRSLERQRIEFGFIVVSNHSSTELNGTSLLDVLSTLCLFDGGDIQLE